MNHAWNAINSILLIVLFFLGATVANEVARLKGAAEEAALERRIQSAINPHPLLTPCPWPARPNLDRELPPPWEEMH